MKIDIPGPGGSLGECVLCGKSFVAEVLLGESHKLLYMNGNPQGMPAHEECCKDIENVHDWHDLPDGPLRQAIEREGK